MIRNTVLHVSNEQPLMADLYSIPTASDAGLLCTNLRMMDGKRPIFIDSSVATFFFPYRVIRFLEIPPGAMEQHAAETGETPGVAHAGATAPARSPEERLPVVVGGPADGPGEGEVELDIDLDIDEGFLQRIRDI